MLASFRRHLNSWVAKAFFLLLVATFVLWGVGDVIRNIGTDTSVATVGGRKIEMPELQDAYRRQLEQVTRMFGSRVEPTPEMRRGIAGQALEQLVTNMALDEGVAALGITEPDEALRQAVFDMPNFKGADGKFSRPTFENLLRNNNLTEPRFLALMRASLAQRQLMDALHAGVISPDTLTKRVYAFQNEKRVADIVTLPFAEAPAPPAPTEAQLTRWYENHPNDYATPELRRIKLVVLSPEAVGREIQIPDADVKAAFDARQAEFQQPERRTLQVLVAKDEAEAKQLAAKWQAGASWDDMQKSGATATELPNATVAEIPSDDLAKAAFAAAPDTVSAPLQTPFGWQVFKVTAVQRGAQKSFDEVKDQLRARLVAEKAADLVYERSSKIDDMLAGGTALDDLPADFGLQALAGTLDAKGNTAEGNPAPFPGDDALRNAILQEAFQAQPGATPHLIEGPRNADGTQAFFALSVESVTPPATKKFEEVKDKVAADWTADARRHAQETEAARILSEVKAGKSLADAALTRTPVRLPPATRTDGAEGMPAQLVDPLFALKQGEPTMVETAEGFTVAVLAEVIPPEPDATAYGQVGDKLADAITGDVQALLAIALRERANPKINQQMLNTITQSE